MNKKASIKNSVVPFIFTLLFVLSLRWLFFEPFVIPSGSLIPSLLVYDHVLVSKFDFGFRLPFSKSWLTKWGEPEPAEIIVFRSKHDDSYFMIKRLMAKSGDIIASDKDGQISINGTKLERRLVDLKDPEIIKKYTPLNFPQRLQESLDLVEIFEESYNGKKYLTMQRKWSPHSREFEYKVPDGEYFFMGDNRDNSSDSRAWGGLERHQLIGRAHWVWLSCDYMLKTLPFLCEPSSFRTERIFMEIN